MSASLNSGHLTIWFRSAALLFTGLAGCGAPQPPKPVAADPQTERVIAVEDEAPVVATGEGLRDAAGALVFVRALCAAAKRGDLAYVEAHAALPLSGQEQAGEDGPWGVVGLWAEEQPELIKYRAVCQYLEETTKELRDFKLEADEAYGVVKLKGQDYRLTFSLNPPRLAEQKLLVPTGSLQAARGAPKAAVPHSSTLKCVATATKRSWRASSPSG